MAVTKKLKADGTPSFYFKFQINGRMFRGTLPDHIRTMRDARLAEAEQKTAARQGRLRSRRESLPLFEFINKVYLPRLQAANANKERETDLCEIICQHFATERVIDITPLLCRRFQDERKQTPVVYGVKADGSFSTRPRTNKTVNREVSVLSGILQLAVDEGLIDQNPCHGLRRLKPEPGRLHFWTVGEAKRVLAELEGEREHLLPLVTAFLFTGLSRSDLFQLKRREVNFERDCLEAFRKKTKTVIEIPIHDNLRPILQELCQDLEPDDLVFLNRRTGKGWVDIKRGLQTAAKRAGVRYVGMHGLRHTFGVWLAEIGTPIHQIRDLMAHTDIRTTNQYLHATDNGKRAAIDKLSLSDKTEGGIVEKSSKKKEPPTRTTLQVIGKFGGPEEDRTPDLRIANAG